MRYALDALPYSYLKKYPQMGSKERIGAVLGVIRDPYGDNQ